MACDWSSLKNSDLSVDEFVLISVPELSAFLIHGDNDHAAAALKETRTTIEL